MWDLAANMPLPASVPCKKTHEGYLSLSLQGSEVRHRASWAEFRSLSPSGHVSNHCPQPLRCFQSAGAYIFASKVSSSSASRHAQSVAILEGLRNSATILCLHLGSANIRCSSTHLYWEAWSIGVWAQISTAAELDVHVPYTCPHVRTHARTHTRVYTRAIFRVPFYIIYTSICHKCCRTVGIYTLNMHAAVALRDFN